MARNRKTLVTVTGVIAVFLALASVAYACVIFKGDLQISSSRPNSNGNKVTGLGGGHGYCPGGEATTSAKASTSNTLTVTVSPADICVSPVPSDPNQLADGNLKIMLRNAPAYVGVDGTQWTMIQGMGCFAGPSTQVGNIGVTNGSGIASNVSLSGKGFVPNAAGTASNLCVGTDVAGKGIMAPLVVVL